MKHWFAGSACDRSGSISDVSARHKVQRSAPIRSTVVCAILLAIGVVCLIDLFLANFRTRALAENRRTLANTAFVIAAQIDHFLEATEAVQRNLADHFAAFEQFERNAFDRSISQYDIHLKLQDKVSGMLHVGALSLFNAAGKLMNFSRSWPVPVVDVSDRDFYRTLRSDASLNAFLGAPVRDGATGAWVMHLARRIPGPNGEFRGVMSNAIELDFFRTFFAQIALERGSSIALFRPDGTLLARHPWHDNELGHRFPSAAVLEIVANAEHGVAIKTGAIDKQFRMIAARRVKNFPIIVGATKTMTTILADWKQTAIYITAFGVLVIAAIVCTAILFIRQFNQYRVLTELRAAQIEEEKNREQRQRVDAAIAHISQGLAIFDAAGRLAMCNERYRTMHDLPLEKVPPGTSIVDIFRIRAANQLQDVDPEGHAADVMRSIAAKRTTTHIVELGDGRIISIVINPMPDGGWVATHEDITEMRSRETSFRLLFDNNPVPMWVFDRNTLRFLAVNQAAIDHYGYSRDQFLRMTVLDIRPSEERSKFAEFVRNFPQDEHGVPGRHLKPDGSVIDVLIYSRGMNYEGRAAALVAVHDITERKRDRDELERTRTFLDAIVENVPLPIMVKDVEGAKLETHNFKFRLINRAAEEFFGVPREQMIGRTAREVYPAESADFVVMRDNETLRSADTIMVREHSVCTPGNGTREVKSAKVAIRDKDGSPRMLLIVLEDVTDRNRAAERIAYMAHYDPLTDLPNRASFNDALDAALERARKTNGSFGLLSIDLDSFKEANDLYGHSVGDGVLREVAQRLKAAAGGSAVFRIGGDEFALILADGEQPQAAADLAERLLDTCRSDIEVDGHPVRIGLCIGIAVFPDNGSDAKTIFNNADIALYRAKSELRGSVRLFDSEMGAELRDRRAMQSELRAAVQEGEISLHYQPQAMINGEVFGFEALARWHSPRRGAVAPVKFIPLAEETGLIIPLGEKILRDACREAAAWERPLQVAVNISPVQFRHADLVSRIHSILFETGLSPHRLEIEVTESAFIEDFSRTLSILRRLKSIGVRIALDDFGTGYSSLSYLHAFPFDKIKIDRTFVCDIEHNQHSVAVIRAIVGLGHSLGVPVLAEGVESKAQCAVLAAEGCTEIQGYLIGRPRPIEKYSLLLRDAGAAKTPDRGELTAAQS